MEQLSHLKGEILEKKFTNVLSKIMENMNKQINECKGKYMKFNQEIEFNDKICKVSNELNFYRQ